LAQHQHCSKALPAQWAAWTYNKLSGAWYERRIKIPADWNNSHISIDFQRISTDATFWVNDKLAGKVNWPEGELDITVWSSRAKK
jgi:beta-galactosidase/beta-glucuronidase